jgi:hypothetical protein
MVTYSQTGAIALGAAFIATTMVAKGQPIASTDTFDTPSPFVSGSLRDPAVTHVVEVRGVQDQSLTERKSEDGGEVGENKRSEEIGGRSLERRKGGSPVRCWS